MRHLLLVDPAVIDCMRSANTESAGNGDGYGEERLLAVLNTDTERESAGVGLTTYGQY